MTEKIVVGTDGSQSASAAVAEATRIAQGLGAELHVVMASRPLRDAHVVGAPAGAVSVYGSMQSGVAEAAVQEAVASARLGGVTAEGHVIDREPADALLGVAADVQASTIVVGNKGMSGGRRLLGSVPNKVSHEAACNVLIVSTR